MASGIKAKSQPDPITDWELAAINLLIHLHPGNELDVKASKQNMLALMHALDRGLLDPALGDPGFMSKTEALLLAMLRGDRIQVADPSTFNAQKEIFAAAQVIYNHAVARGFWGLHPEIQQAMERKP